MRSTTALKIGAALVVIWTAFGLLSSTHFFFRESAVSASASFGETAPHVLVFYWLWALLTPPVILVARRAVRRGAGWREWGTVALMAPAIIGLHGILFAISLRLLGISSSASVEIAQIQRFAMRHGGGDLATFAVIVGICLLIESNRRARERELAASALEARLARADLELLRWHLHPHFLFNALNTVSTLVLKQQTDSAENAISLISRYLRAALAQRADSTIPLADEMAMVDRYVDIERLRFGDALTVEKQIDSDTLRARVPSLIVQPLVENAIMHGAAQRPGSDQVTISASRNDGRLRIRVSNPLGNHAEASVGRDSNSFGIRYVQERLRQFYGDDARFDLLTSDAGAVATLDIPFSGEVTTQ